MLGERKEFLRSLRDATLATTFLTQVTASNPIPRPVFTPENTPYGSVKEEEKEPVRLSLPSTYGRHYWTLPGGEGDWRFGQYALEIDPGRWLAAQDPEKVLLADEKEAEFFMLADFDPLKPDLGVDLFIGTPREEGAYRQRVRLLVRINATEKQALFVIWHYFRIIEIFWAGEKIPVEENSDFNVPAPRELPEPELKIKI